MNGIVPSLSPYRCNELAGKRLLAVCAAVCGGLLLGGCEKRGDGISNASAPIEKQAVIQVPSGELGAIFTQWRSGEISTDVAIWKMQNLDNTQKQLGKDALSLLEQYPSSQGAEDPANEVFNELIGVMLKAPLPAETAQAFIAMVDESSRSEMQRDYLLQHCQYVWKREGNAAARKNLEECMWKHARDGRPTTAASALLAIAQIYPESSLSQSSKLVVTEADDSSSVNMHDPAFSREDWLLLLRSLISDAKKSPEVRIAALQCAQQAKDLSILPVVRIIVQDVTAPKRLRLDAVNALVALSKERSDVELLERIAAHESDLRTYVKAAAENIQSRLGQ